MKSIISQLAGCLVLLLPVRMAHAATPPGAVEIDPETRALRITDWGYDIKNASAIDGLTPTKAQQLFVDDRMSVLRVSIWGDSVMPAHPAAGEIDVSYYVYDSTVSNSKKMFTAMKNVRDARPDVRFFASKKSQSTSMPAWTKNNGSLISANYARMLADYLRFWEHDLTRKSEGFTFDILGINNEGAAFSKTEYAKHKEVIDELRVLSQQSGTVDLVDSTHATHVRVTVPAAFTMPRLIIGPERWSPEPGEVADLLAIPGAGSTLDLIGTHYYPERRYYTDMANMLVNGKGRPGWNSEVHWDDQSALDELQDAESALATVFDNMSAGFTGYCWWAYTRTGFKGGMEQALTTSTMLSRPCSIDDEDGYQAKEALGTLITRAFREGNSLRIWAMNVGRSEHPNHAFNLLRGEITGDVTFKRWANVAGSFVSSNGTVSPAGTSTFHSTLPGNSITMFTLAYRPPGAAAVYSFDGDTLDGSGAGRHGTPSGAVSYSAVQDSQCLDLNGTNASVSIPRMISKEFTIAFWMQSVQSGPVGATAQWWRGSGLVDGEVNGSVDDFGISLYGNNVAFGIGKPDTTILSNTAMVDGQWRHVVATRNSITGEMELFINGKSEAAVIGPVGSKAAASALRIGRLQSGSNHFKGRIDDVRIYDRVLEASEIQKLASSGAAGSGILVAYDFNSDATDGNAATVVRSMVSASRLTSPMAVSLSPTIGDDTGVDAFGFDLGNTSTLGALGIGVDQASTGSFAAAVAGDDYLTFTVTPNEGVALALEGIAFKASKKASTSVDEYAVADASGVQIGGSAVITNVGSLTGAYDKVIVDLTGTACQRVTKATEFRIYAWGRGTSSTNNTLAAIDKITLRGRINHTPVAAGTSVSTPKEIPLNINLSASDPEGGDLTFRVESQPTHGTLSGTAPNLTYTPTSGYAGNDSFTFTANDGLTDSTAALVSIHVEGTASVGGYADWSVDHELSGGFDDDDDHDGIDNGMEFVLNGNPLIPDLSILPSAMKDGTHLKFSYTRAPGSKTSTVQTVQWSTDLVGWNDIEVESSAPDTVTINIPLTPPVDGRLYTRLKVTLP